MEEASILTSEELADLARGGSEWRRSKIMIVGEGRAGKTALARSVIGEPFEETDSTFGIQQLTCVINQVATGGDGSWKQSQGRNKEYEAALARNMKEKEAGESKVNQAKSILDSSLNNARDTHKVKNNYS